MSSRASPYCSGAEKFYDGVTIAVWPKTTLRTAALAFICGKVTSRGVAHYVWT